MTHPPGSVVVEPVDPKYAILAQRVYKFRNAMRNAYIDPDRAAFVLTQTEARKLHAVAAAEHARSLNLTFLQGAWSGLELRSEQVAPTPTPEVPEPVPGTIWGTMFGIALVVEREAPPAQPVSREPMAMDDLIAFIHARLDEEEQTARAVDDNSPPWPGVWKTDGENCLRTYNDWVLIWPGIDGHPFAPGLIAHIARHDPARTLRDIQARRQTLVRCQEELLSGIPRLAWFAKMTLWEMAQRWADQEGFKEAWKP